VAILAKKRYRRGSERGAEDAARATEGHPGVYEDPVVSTDMLHNPNSSIVDAGLTKVLMGTC